MVAAQPPGGAMDFQSLSDDELADVTRDLLEEFHRRHAALPHGTFRNRSGRLLRVAHGAFDALKDLAQDEERISPFSGGDPKPEGEP